MSQLKPVRQENCPELALVYRDVNSTVAAALVCAKLLAPVGHVDAGLRSSDRPMPEEANSVVTDQLAGLLFTPSADAMSTCSTREWPTTKFITSATQ